jgi:ketosteroid isomerase-like protein
LSQQNLEIVRSLYAAFAKGDVPAVLGVLAPNLEWREADNFIYADGNPYVGPAAVLQGVFLRLATEWNGFAAVPQQFFDAGGAVIVSGRYTGAYKATGKKIDAQFAHHWTLEDGKVTHFQQYTDTLQVAQAATA